MEEREKTTSVHGDSAGSSNGEAFHEPSNEHAAPTELKEGPRGLSAIDMALLRSFSNRFKVPVHARSETRLSMNRVARIKQRPPLHKPPIQWRRARRIRGCRGTLQVPRTLKLS